MGKDGQDMIVRNGGHGRRGGGKGRMVSEGYNPIIIIKYLYKQRVGENTMFPIINITSILVDRILYTYLARYYTYTDAGYYI